MNLYRWESKMLKGWANGFIIVQAETIQVARQKVKGKAFEWLKENKFCNYDPTEDGELLNEYLDTLDEDLEKDPETMEVMFMMGSE